jgi:exosortase
MGWRPLAETFTLSAREDEYTYILLILPISLALIWIERQSFKKAIARSVGLGSAFLLAATLIAWLCFRGLTSLSTDVRLSMEMMALILWWIGAFVLWFGTYASRSILFPLCFLFGLVPPPRIVLDAIVAFLQLGSAWAAHGLFAIFGVPVVQSGVYLTIPGLTVQVAQECSSIRSSSMLLLTSIVLSQLLLRSSWRRILLVLVAIPLTIAKNGLRIFMIAMLGTRVDPGYLNGRLHRQGGILYFAAALIAEFVLLWKMRRDENLQLLSSLERSDQAISEPAG